MRGVAFQRSSCAFSKAWASSSVFTTTPSCVVEVESMTSPHLYGHHPPCACLQKGKLPTHLSTCSPRPKANGTEQNQYLTKDCKPDSRQQKRFWWLLLRRHSCYKICLSHQSLWPWTQLRYYRILSFYFSIWSTSEDEEERNYWRERWNHSVCNRNNKLKIPKTWV